MKAKVHNLVEMIRDTRLAKPMIELWMANAGRGIVAALKDGEMTLEEAENQIFNMDVYAAARKRRLDRNLLEFLQWGMQLEDVAELAPERLANDYRRMSKLLHRVFPKSGRTGRPARPGRARVLARA
jgi:hypothetical protein